MQAPEWDHRGYQSIKIETIAVGNGRRFKTEAIFHQGFAIIDPFVHQFETFHFRLGRFIVTRGAAQRNSCSLGEAFRYDIAVWSKMAYE
jgi:hypothetical protein